MKKQSQNYVIYLGRTVLIFVGTGADWEPIVTRGFFCNKRFIFDNLMSKTLSVTRSNLTNKKVVTPFLLKTALYYYCITDLRNNFDVIWILLIEIIWLKMFPSLAIAKWISWKILNIYLSAYKPYSPTVNLSLITS